MVMLSSVKNDVRCAVISATDFQQKQPGNQVS